MLLAVTYGSFQYMYDSPTVALGNGSACRALVKFNLLEAMPKNIQELIFLGLKNLLRSD